MEKLGSNQSQQKLNRSRFELYSCTMYLHCIHNTELSIIIIVNQGYILSPILLDRVLCITI